jgi:hypothetical protein
VLLYAPALPINIAGIVAWRWGSGRLTRLFYGFVALGVALTIALAAVYPLPENERFRSSIAVIPDGGRQESFTIQWPQDRLQPALAASNLEVAGGAAVLRVDGAPGASAEVFRLRDMAGNVVGLASRSTSVRGAPGGVVAEGSDWVLLLPSRGAVFMTQANARDVAPRTLARGSTVPAADDVGFWAGTTSVRISAGPAAGGAGRVVGGTGEFDGLQGSYDETWELEEAGAVDGITRGRITLDTRMQAQ